VSGLLLLVQGEAEFDTTGFALVMSASCMSGLRFTLTQLLLHGSKGAAEGGRNSSDGGGHSECVWDAAAFMIVRLRKTKVLPDRHQLGLRPVLASSRNTMMVEHLP
jgi:hypothetical protein